LEIYRPSKQISTSRENIVTHKYLWRGVLFLVMSVALAAPARADNLSTTGRNIVIGIVAVTAAIAVVVTVLILHESRKDKIITGCVKSSADGMIIADENNSRVYAVTGNTVGITPGERFRLKGKKAKSRDSGRNLIWVTTSVNRDLGACTP
jgi:hypothetical protein